MCRASQNIKLCTCGGNEIDTDANWTLYTTQSVEELLLRPVVIGSVTVKKGTATGRHLLQEKLASDLNSSNCFDFDYQPKHGDILIINIGEEVFGFNYSGLANHAKSWESDPFAVSKVGDSNAYLRGQVEV